MRSEDLTREQARALKNKLQPMLGYLNRLKRLTTDQSVALCRHADDIAALPPSQRNAVLELISSQTDRFVQFVGRFVEQNPGKVLFTTAGTGLILAESERSLGGDEIK